MEKLRNSIKEHYFSVIAYSSTITISWLLFTIGGMLDKYPTPNASKKVFLERMRFTPQVFVICTITAFLTEIYQNHRLGKN